ncbi:MAG: glycogen/starch/alpha-glucan phosphorylase, partial [Chlamydiia bacterium]|nr:glycogen/starch/alpha-glucan phosphorylase [Chlamydiia bacterium]
LTIGTLDGANVEMLEEIGAANMYIFGLKTEEVRDLKISGYNPWRFFESDSELREALEQIRDGFFSPGQRDLFKPIVDSLLHGGDHYLVLADYRAFINCQDQVSADYRDREAWTRRSIINVAKTGKFSSDRTIAEYAQEIWGVETDYPPKK